MIPEVVVYGTVCLDRFVFVDADGTPAPVDIQEIPGGEAFNTATALAGWNVPVLLTGTAIGYDPEGDRLRALLDSSPLGMPHPFVPDDPAAVTPLCTIRVFPDGERQMSGRGFREAVAPPPLSSEILAARPLYVTDPNLGPPAVTACLRAVEFGCPVLSMDMAHLPEIVAISQITVTSGEVLRRHGETHEPKEVVQGLVDQGAQTAIVTLGAEGCVVADRDKGVFSVQAFRLPDIIDTTGAGDTFRAGLCWGIRTGLSLEETLRFASAAAALHCQVIGGGSRVLLQEVQKLIEISR